MIAMIKTPVFLYSILHMHTPKRILIFSLAYYPRFVGGAEAAIKEITDRIPPSDCEFDMITLRFDAKLPRFEPVGAVNVYRIGPALSGITLAQLASFPWYLIKVWYPIGAFFKALALHRARHYDALWSMMTYMGFPAVLFKLLYKPRMPYILTLQDGDRIAHIISRWRIRLVYPLLALVFSKPAVVQTISHYLADFARTMGYRGTVEVIPNGVDIATFTRTFSDEALERTRLEIGKKRGETYLVTTSRLVYKNAIDDVIKALPLLPQHIKFLVIGEGPDEAMLKDLVKKFGVAERVIFLGFVPNADLPRYLKACDIFIRPSRSEGMGSSFVEAFAAGIPVIATQEGGIADFLFDTEANPDKPATGFAVRPNDPSDIARVVRKILTNPEESAKVAATARALALEKYDWPLIARAMREKVFDRAR